MPILPKHAIDVGTFEDTTFEPILGTGPYRVGAVKPGDSVTFTRDPNYWGRDLPINRGLWNFDTIRFDYYRDGNTHFEAFKKGLYDVRAETDPGRWQTAYDFPALRDGKVVKEAFPYGLPKGMQGFVFNTRRRDLCRYPGARGDPAIVRFRMDQPQLFLRSLQAHRELFRRLRSFRPWRCRQARASSELLKPFPGAVRADIMAGTWAPPVTDGSGRDRKGLRRAFDLFAQAGYALKARNWCTSRPASRSRSRSSPPRAIRSGWRSLSRATLKRAGIDAHVRNVDATQYERRRIAFDFDMMKYHWDQSLSPGNEQLFYWGSAAADDRAAATTWASSRRRSTP